MPATDHRPPPAAALLSPRTVAAPRLDAELRERGYAVSDALALGELLGAGSQALEAWLPLWARLPPDPHLRDGGRYRYRRHGCFVVDGTAVRPVAPRAHWQPLEYNALHGGYERWFEPLEPLLPADPLWAQLLRVTAARASALRGAQPWFVEAHQFRIDTAEGIGRPTPEGAHRDGVDLVAVMLVQRNGVKGGETRVFEADGPRGERFTLAQPWSVLWLDDARVIHETTPIQPLATGQPGWRDTLVLTCRAGGFQGPPAA
jgi:hypothetical protein